MIFDYLTTVGGQVLILFILIAVGYICGLVGFMNKDTAKHITNIVLYFVTPCVIIDAYQVDFDPNILTNLGITALCAIGVHIVSIIVATLVFRGKNINKRSVLRFGAIFSNCGFMSLPLQQAIIGKEGVLYGAAFVCMGGKENFSKKTLLLNPGILGVVVAVLLFIFSIKLPSVIAQPISYLAGLNTPLPMIIVGYYLSNSKMKEGLKDKYAWSATILRLLVIPIICLVLLYLIGLRGNILITVAIAVSAPAAATTTMFAAKFDRDTELSVNIVSLSTIFSIVTMSCIVAITNMLA